ncbi:hypothetical protein NL521_29785, partial [Klebsiella pneumoniae]|nr:hypothetical protein [Klebsiella pneumoniae]
MEQQIAKDKPVVTQKRLFELLKSDSDNSGTLKLLQSIAKKEDFSPAAVLSVSYWHNSDRLQRIGMEERLLQDS